MNRPTPIVLLIVAALIAASVTTWASHVTKRRVDWGALNRQNDCYGLVGLGELAGLSRGCAYADFSSAAYQTQAAQAYFRRLVQRAQPYYQPPAELIEIWTQGGGEESGRYGWPFVTYQSTSFVEFTVKTPADSRVIHHLYADADGSEPRTDYTAMAKNLGVHFAGWLLFLMLLPHVVWFIRRRLYPQRHGFPVIMREDEV